MKRDTFLNKMLVAKNNLSIGHCSYCCHALLKSFNYNDGVVDLYRDVINGRDYPKNGMFGLPRKEKNQNARMLSLEIFERVVLDGKLYRGL